MKTIRTMILACCLTAPAAHAETTTLASVELHKDSLSQLSQAGFYGAIGTCTALGGVVLTILGIKGIAEKDKKGGPIFLTLSGVALLLAGINIATGK